MGTGLRIHPEMEEEEEEEDGEEDSGEEEEDEEEEEEESEEEEECVGLNGLTVKGKEVRKTRGDDDEDEDEENEEEGEEAPPAKKLKRDSTADASENADGFIESRVVRNSDIATGTAASAALTATAANGEPEESTDAKGTAAVGNAEDESSL